MLANQEVPIKDARANQGIPSRVAKCTQGLRAEGAGIEIECWRSHRSPGGNRDSTGACAKLATKGNSLRGVVAGSGSQVRAVGKIRLGGLVLGTVKRVFNGEG